MKTIVLASENPVKIEAALRGFGRFFPGETFRVRSVKVSSGVSDQPLSEAETLRGALGRAQGAAQATRGDDYWVGMEGGIEPTDGGLSVFAWIVVLGRDPRGGGEPLLGRGRTGSFFLPPAVTALVREGLELGDACDRIFGRKGSKREGGAIGLLTGGVIDRASLYEPAVIMALLPFRNPELYGN